MSGDYSRIRFDPSKDIASVWMQQGRVQLDSDWNEGMAVLDRRLRAESVDTFGVHPVPGRMEVAVVSPQTPDAFKISTDNGKITIGQGRMYVDGLLVENHGYGIEKFDPVLAEVYREGALPYEEQPYFLAPSALPQGPCLVYLEVWQRELTHLQYPEMVENAVGVDTTTRWQTVWQVRFLVLGEENEEETHVNCSTPDDQLSGWQALTRSSAGRMSIRAVATPADTDPCELPPSGGYRGLENQLYRIEIHDGGAVGKATFKWSRDNASVASSVVEILEDGKKLRLASLGRDTELRFNTDDWVEILDDRCELDGEKSDPALRRGVMRKITAVYNDSQTIEFSPALPADLVPANNDELAVRHMRVRRWDQKGTVHDTNGNLIVNLDDPDSPDLIPIPAPGVWVELEKGIQVQFNHRDDGEFRCGDYWVSAARTVDTSIETLENAPPRGIHRHYTRLAIVDFDNDSQVVSDCRTHWPPACGGGGCCTITIAPGESIQDALDALPNEGGCVCLKTGVHDIVSPVQISRSNVILQGESPGVIVRSNETALKIGDRVDSVVVQRIRFEAGEPQHKFYLLEAENCTRLRVIDCEFIAKESTVGQVSGLHFQEVVDAIIANNHIRNMWNGITITEDTSRGIDIRNNFLEGDDNSLDLATVRAVINAARFDSDEIADNVETFGSGIRISLSETEKMLSREISREISIRSNRLVKFRAGISMDTLRSSQLAASGVVVDENFITQCTYGIAAIGGKYNRIRNNHIDATGLGIRLFKESDPEISGNHLYYCGCGILMSELNGAVALLNNRLMNCGLLPTAEGECFSIRYVGNNQEKSKNGLPNNATFRIDGCEIIDTGVDDTQDGNFIDGSAYGIHIHDSLTALQITNNRIDYTVTSLDVRKGEHRALRLVRDIAGGELFPPLSGGVLITGNQFRGYGHSALVEAVFRSSTIAPPCTFSNNICNHLNSEDNGEDATVVLKGERSGTYFVVMGNQITSFRGGFSLSLAGARATTCMGNLMTGKINLIDSATIVPSSYQSFNIIGSAV